MGNIFFLMMFSSVLAMASLYSGDEVSHMKVRTDFSLPVYEIQDQIESGHFYTGLYEDWYIRKILSVAIIAERLSQVADDYSTAQEISLSDLGISNLAGSKIGTVIEVNGSGAGQILLDIPSQIDPNTFVSRLNKQLGNEFTGIYDGVDLVTDRSNFILNPGGFPTSLNTSDIAIILP